MLQFCKGKHRDTVSVKMRQTDPCVFFRRPVMLPAVRRKNNYRCGFIV